MQATMLPPSADVPSLELRVERGAPSGPGSRPLLFIHGLGHGAWCWDDWLAAARESGRTAYALSLRGHGASEGSTKGARLADYESDVIRAARHIGDRPILVGHSLGGLVAQRAAARAGAGAVVLLATIPPRPAVHTVLRVLRHQPAEALRYIVGRPLRLAPKMFFADPADPAAREAARHLQAESALVQYQLLFHRPRALPSIPVLSVASADDRLVPVTSARATARRFGGDFHVLDGVGHDLMLGRSSRQAWDVIADWLTRQDVP